MASLEDVLRKVVSIVNEALDSDDRKADADTPLIGDAAIVSSRELVEILLGVEEYAEDDLNVAFDWSSDAAMSAKRSPFRSPRTLAERLIELKASTSA